MNSAGEHPEEIPTEFNEEQTLRAVRKQTQIPGERKEKTINDFPKAAGVGRILKDLDFPVDKRTIVTFVEKLNTPQSREILPIKKSLMRASTKMFQKLQMLWG
jgi:hypothetical protein